MTANARSTMIMSSTILHLLHLRTHQSITGVTIAVGTDVILTPHLTGQVGHQNTTHELAIHLPTHLMR